MEGRTSWVSHCFGGGMPAVRGCDSFSEIIHERNKEEVAVIPFDSLLPDELLERIITFLPIASIIRASSVSKRWHEIVTSRRFLRSLTPTQQPWYFMFTSCDDPIGYAYDPFIRKWYNIKLPCIDKSNFFVSSSGGLVCFMDASELYICNPIMNSFKKLEEPPGLKFSDYSTLAMSVDRNSHGYIITVVKSKQVPGDFHRWDLSIHEYDSATMAWASSWTEILDGWRSGNESVICDGVLHLLIYSTAVGLSVNRHGLVSYCLSGQSQNGLLMKSFIPVPCLLTCGRLMNLDGKLVMVGGVGKPDRLGVIKGIGIWVLEGNRWQEVARMPQSSFQKFGEIDDVFASGGIGDLIYIHSYGAPLLLVFDMKQKQWRWSHKCPVAKKFTLQLFTGFCFEPSFGIAP